MDATISHAALAVVAVLAWQSLRARSRADPSRRLHHDEDGTATRESQGKSPDIQVAKMCMNAAATIGTSGAILDSSYSAPTGQWSLPGVAAMPRIGIWLLIGLQVLASANETSIRHRYKQGVCKTLSSAVCIFHSLHPSIQAKYHVATVWTDIFCATVVAVACLSLPRRPALRLDGRRVDQQNSASILSLLSFSWHPLYEPSFPKFDDLSPQDLPVLPSAQRIRHVRQAFRACSGRGTLLRQLVLTWRYSIALQWLLTFMHSISQFIRQYMLLQLLRHLEGASAREPRALMSATAMGLAMLLENISAGWITWVTQAKLSIPMTALLKALTFEKMTVLQKRQQPERPVAEHKTNLHSMEALMSSDCASVAQACSFSQHCPKLAFKLLFEVTYLVDLIGIKHILLGCSFPIILFPVSKMLSHQHRLAKLELSKRHNAFSIEVSEFLRNLRVIRLSSMEDFWERRIIGSRARELRQIWQCGMIMAVLTLVTNLGPILLVSVALSSYALELGHLSPSLAFASIGLFRNLHASVQELPTVVSNLQESLAASQRLETYLQQPSKAQIIGGSSTLRFRDATIAWPGAEAIQPSATSPFKLSNVRLQFPKGKLSLITGKTSSGKGLLLSALLGEADIESGHIHLKSPSLPAEKSLQQDVTAIAFVSQPPWIEDRTIKDNILFGSAYDEQRYLAVLHACALERDLEALPDRDLTKAGVNGGALSGGQKWRVSLARALYSPGKTIILDDVLSAVDPHVARWLCHNALSGELARGRTIIIATHHLALCEPLASYIVTVDGGTASGRPNYPQASLKQPLNVEPMPRSATSSPGPDAARNMPNVKTRKAKVLLKRSSIQNLSAYLLGSGIWPVVLATVATFVCRLFATGNSWWLAKWTSNNKLDSRTLSFNLYIYLIMSFGSGIAVALHALAVHGVSLQASSGLFQRSIAGVLHSPLRWIDSMSLGQLLQSLASDMYLIDHRVAPGLSDLLRIVTQLVLIICTSGVATPQTIILMVIIFGFYLKITVRHLSMSRRLNGLVPVASQPILEHANSTESGILTIRAFGKGQSYVEHMYDLLDVDVRLNWHLVLGQRWIHGRYGFMGSLFVCATAATLVFRGADAATAGFVLTIALEIKATMSGMMGKINLLTSGARAIDRVLNIAESPTESQDGKDTEASWPSEGRLQVENITVGYDSALPPVLRNVSFSLAGHQRLGIVGRTGAGKSSLVNALLRLNKISEGRIRIDGVDIASIKLGELRRSVSTIPQDPFLFSGTLRANLNIHGDRTDEELLAAMKKIKMTAENEGDAADALDNLDMVMQPGGADLSHGQRQMVCLARAVLDPRRIVIFDEATSAVDEATDAMIQAVLRREFAGSTIIVVAHRPATVADFDRILVMSEGEAVEFGSPSELIAKKGLFWDMVNQRNDSRDVRIPWTVVKEQAGHRW